MSHAGRASTCLLVSIPLPSCLTDSQQTSIERMEKARSPLTAPVGSGQNAGRPGGGAHGLPVPEKDEAPSSPLPCPNPRERAGEAPQVGIHVPALYPLPGALERI